MIDYLPSLLNQPVQFYSCFISYSDKDDDFVQRLHADLQNKGIRCLCTVFGSPAANSSLAVRPPRQSRRKVGQAPRQHRRRTTAPDAGNGQVRHDPRGIRIKLSG